MSKNKIVNNNDYVLNANEHGSFVNVSDIQVEKPSSDVRILPLRSHHDFQAIKGFSCKIANSLKNSLNYCVNTEQLANESILNLCAQNEQLNRIKRDLNESHDKVTITEKLVDRYVSAIGWISSTMKWNNSVKLDIKDSDASFNELGRSAATTCDCTASEACCKSTSALNQPVKDLFNHTTQGLSSFLTSMKNNRVKTDLISNMIVHQNCELDKINSSAHSLRDRVSTINRTLKE